MYVLSKVVVFFSLCGGTVSQEFAAVFSWTIVLPITVSFESMISYIASHFVPR